MPSSTQHFVLDFLQQQSSYLMVTLLTTAAIVTKLFEEDVTTKFLRRTKAQIADNIAFEILGGFVVVKHGDLGDEGTKPRVRALVQ
uniref:Secreted protein n=1 Tax=Panagrellus redivivus TaxID=6233 RepID=A0A7E4V4K4_PANRE